MPRECRESRVNTGLNLNSWDRPAWRRAAVKTLVQASLLRVRSPTLTPFSCRPRSTSTNPCWSFGGAKATRSSSSTIASASRSLASSCSCTFLRCDTMSSPFGTPVRSRIRAKSICPGRVRVPSMSNTTPRKGGSSLPAGPGAHRAEQWASGSGDSMTRLLWTSRSSGGTRRPSYIRGGLPTSASTVFRSTPCNTAPAFSSASGSSSGCTSDQARIIAAMRSPVPVKGPPVMRGRRSTHFTLCPFWESSMATSVSLAMGSTVVIATTPGPMVWSWSTASAASRRVVMDPRGRPRSFSTSNWFGVNTWALGRTSRA
mmetsp:Transcript_23160/g.59508  ORF Transcript_23160/g.59508 Transcript_23160/m.59508 type:complete len:315 (+) Transcript_23160:1128-2072(+)